MDVFELMDKVLGGEDLSLEEKKYLFELPDDKILELILAAHKIKVKFTGRGVSACSIISAKTGYCSEDCAFCAQSKVSRAVVEKHSLLEPEKILEHAFEAENYAERFSIVTSGRGYEGDEREFKKILKAVEMILDKTDLKVDVSLGLLSRKAVKALAEAGVERIHHNVETSRSYFGKICSTHTFEDKIRTIEAIKGEGLEICSGFIIGMGESVEDRIEIAEILNSLEVNSVPINVLIPIQGTPLEGRTVMTPFETLKNIAAFRFLMPDRELRLCGGRLQSLGDFQALSLFVLNGILVGKRALTTYIRDPELDRRMLELARNI